MTTKNKPPDSAVFFSMENNVANNPVAHLKGFYFSVVATFWSDVSLGRLNPQAGW